MAFLRLLVDTRCHHRHLLRRRLQLLRDFETHSCFNRASSSSSSIVSSLFRGEDARARSGFNNDNNNTYLSTRKGHQRDCANARRMFSSSSASTSSSSSTSGGSGGMNDVVNNKSSEKVDALLEQFTSLTAKEKRDVFQSLFVTTDRGESDMSEKERKMFEEFDSDGDNLLTPEEFQNFHRAFLWRHLQEQQVISGDERGEEDHGYKEITYAQLKSVALSQMYPFIGFGFLDNALMLAFGETIEASVGVSLGLSTMAAAAIGNTLSDVCGVGLANKIEYLCAKFGLTSEVKMTACQAKEVRVVVARLGGAMTGVTMGCIAGSFPLLFH